MKYSQTVKLLLFIYLFGRLLNLESKSFLKIDVVEAVNLHCKMNNEFHCNPYAVIDFENYEKLRQSTHKLDCTKNPKWESSFTFHPKLCSGRFNVDIFQFLTPEDIAYIGKNNLYDEQNYNKGEIEAGYLGRVSLELEKLPFGEIDDWFLIESPQNQNRIQFPSCVHLRIKWVFLI